jgi:hypothetical protein
VKDIRWMSAAVCTSELISSLSMPLASSSIFFHQRLCKSYIRTGLEKKEHWSCGMSGNLGEGAAPNFHVISSSSELPVPSVLVGNQALCRNTIRSSLTRRNIIAASMLLRFTQIFLTIFPNT